MMLMLSDIVNGIVKLVRKLGFGEGYGVVFAHLLISEKPLTVRELSKRTGYSPSAVAMYLSVLHRSYLVERSKQGNTFVYSAKIDYLDRWRDWVKDLLEKDIQPLVETLENAVENIKEEERKDHLRKILVEFRKTKEFLERVLNMEI